MTLFLALLPPFVFLICTECVCVCARALVCTLVGRPLWKLKERCKCCSCGVLWVLFDFFVTWGFSPSVLGCLTRELRGSVCLCLSRTGIISMGHPPARQTLTDSASPPFSLLPWALSWGVTFYVVTNFHFFFFFFVLLTLQFLLGGDI